MRGLTKKSLVTLNSPPSGRRRMEILTTLVSPNEDTIDFLCCKL